MNDVNWWLMALAFVLGLLLTFAFMIRRVTREVPIYAALGRGPGVDVPDVNLKGAGLAAGAGLAGGAAAAKLSGELPDIVDQDPYGAGSLRLATGSKFGPSGYVVKGNEDSMLYHTTESPSYEQTIAEVWFRDAESAERAGFARWDSNKGKAAGLVAGAAVAGGAVAAKFVGDGPDVEADEPYGAGSVRLVSAGKIGPSGYVVKGNEDSMLYHTTESPSYEQTIAEVWFRDTDSAERAGFARWDSNKGSGGTGGGAAKFADIPPGPYGAGSAKGGDGGAGPEGWLVKGNEDSMLYHTTDSPSYKQTIAELWFVDEETAQKAGFQRWDINKK